MLFPRSLKKIKNISNLLNVYKNKFEHFDYTHKTIFDIIIDLNEIRFLSLIELYFRYLIFVFH